jgi:hypothetical protein
MLRHTRALARIRTGMTARYLVPTTLTAASLILGIVAAAYLLVVLTVEQDFA